MFSCAHFEHASAVLADLDPEALVRSMERVKAGDKGALNDLLEALARGGKARVFRKLAAINKATLEELLNAEMDPTKLREMEEAWMPGA